MSRSMTRKLRIFHAIALSVLLAQPAPLRADPVLIADFADPAVTAQDWRFFTDGVMGGVSGGQAVIADGALHLSGTVSTRNNGGFIQVRRDDTRLPAATTALRMSVQGDGQTYYIHLRTTRTLRPWHYFQAGFTAPPGWTEIDLPLAAFRASWDASAPGPSAQEVRSIALVAWGRDHLARVSLRRIEAD